MSFRLSPAYGHLRGRQGRKGSARLPASASESSGLIYQPSNNIMSKTNTRLMKLFWLIEDGANAEAIMAFLGKTGRADWKPRQQQKAEERPRDDRSSVARS